MEYFHMVMQIHTVLEEVNIQLYFQLPIRFENERINQQRIESGFIPPTVPMYLGVQFFAIADHLCEVSVNSRTLFY